MDSQEVIALVDKNCPNKHRVSSHKILPIPRRDDICLVFCEGWNNRLFFVWEKNKTLFLKEAGGKDGFQIIVNKRALSIKGDILEIYCGVLNFVGSSGGRGTAYNLGKNGFANPIPIKTASPQ